MNRSAGPSPLVGTAPSMNESSGEPTVPSVNESCDEPTLRLDEPDVAVPSAIDAVHARLGTTPATVADFASLVSEMGLPDGEG